MTDAPADNPTPPAALLPLSDADVFPVVRSAAVLGAGTLVLAGLIYAGLFVANQPLHANLNLMAAALCGGTALVALLPVWLGSKQSSHGAATGFMASILIRMSLDGGVVMYAQWATDWPHAQLFSYWVAGWHLAVLLIEVKLISSFVLAIAPGPPRYPQFHSTSADAPSADATTIAPTTAPAPSH